MPKVLKLLLEIQHFQLPKGLRATSWDSQSFWIEETFSFSGAFESGSLLDLSPYVLMDARLSFLLSLLNSKLKTSLIGVPPLAALVYQLTNPYRVSSSEDFSLYWNEYSHKKNPDEDHHHVEQTVILNGGGEELGITYVASFEKMPHGRRVHEWSFDRNSEMGEFYILKRN